MPPCKRDVFPTASSRHKCAHFTGTAVHPQPEEADRKPEPTRPRSMAGVREEGLAKPVGGIGLALLEKMGYQKGSGLGAAGTGIAEPLAIEMRNRSGLGVFEARVRGSTGLPPGGVLGQTCRAHSPRRSDAGVSPAFIPSRRSLPQAKKERKLAAAAKREQEARRVPSPEPGQVDLAAQTNPPAPRARPHDAGARAPRAGGRPRARFPRGDGRRRGCPARPGGPLEGPPAH